MYSTHLNIIIILIKKIKNIYFEHMFHIRKGKGFTYETQEKDRNPIRKIR